MTSNDDKSPGTLSHAATDGSARMVDVSAKTSTARTATATGYIRMTETTLAALRANQLKKGDVLGVAKVAGIMAAKQTAALIPMCHPLTLTHVDVTAVPDDAIPGVVVTARVSTMGQTGVEMEALTATTIALVTVYDMAKSSDPAMEIGGIHVVEKTK